MKLMTHFVKRLSVLMVVIVLISACTAGQNAVAGGGDPVLLEDVALEPTTPEPTRVLSPTPSPELPPDNVEPTQFTNELLSPLEVVTIDADFVIVTPTLPPSKTPTQTPTATTTPTQTPTPTQTVTATSTAFVFPTSVFIPVTAPVVAPIDAVCDTAWDFIVPRPQGCPLAPSSVGPAVYQEFERGFMIWDGVYRQIYVLFNDGGTPFWTRFPDTFVEGQGMFPNYPWKDPAIDGQAPPGLYQPVRGFGRLWRNEDNDMIKASVRPRVGWGTMEFEEVMSLRLQTRQDGTLFITLLRDGFQYRVFQLSPGGPWLRFAG